MELRYDLRKLGIHHEQEDLDAHEAAKLMIKEIERLREKANSLLTTIYDAGDLLDDGELTATSNTLDAAKFKHNLEK